MAELIKKLGDGNYRVRERATNDLVSDGRPRCWPTCASAAKDPDGERARRAEDCITKINAERRQARAGRDGPADRPAPAGRGGRGHARATCRSPTTTTA